MPVLIVFLIQWACQTDFLFNLHLLGNTMRTSEVNAYLSPGSEEALKTILIFLKKGKERSVC